MEIMCFNSVIIRSANETQILSDAPITRAK